MACVNLIRSWTTAILLSFSQETDLLVKAIMKCVSIKLWDILCCFHYILNAPRTHARFSMNMYLLLGICVCMLHKYIRVEVSKSVLEEEFPEIQSINHYPNIDNCAKSNLLVHYTKISRNKLSITLSWQSVFCHTEANMY